MWPEWFLSLRKIGYWSDYDLNMFISGDEELYIIICGVIGYKNIIIIIRYHFVMWMSIRMDSSIPSSTTKICFGNGMALTDEWQTCMWLVIIKHHTRYPEPAVVVILSCGDVLIDGI